MSELRIVVSYVSILMNKSEKIGGGFFSEQSPSTITDRVLTLFSNEFFHNTKEIQMRYVIFLLLLGLLVGLPGCSESENGHVHDYNEDTPSFRNGQN